MSKNPGHEACNGKLNVKKSERKSTVQTETAKSRNICEITRMMLYKSQALRLIQKYSRQGRKAGNKFQ